MKYITVKEASLLWNIDISRIGKLLRAEKIEGATRVGGHWLIPQEAPKPEDGRKRGKVAKGEEDFFRYPEFAFQDLSSFYPPLTEEELQLKETEEVFLSCRYEEAEKILGDLPDRATNRYCRLYALFMGCLIAAETGNVKGFLDRFSKLKTEMKEDFPRKKEMSFLVGEVESVLGDNTFFIDKFSVDATYDYHASFLPHLAEACSVSLYLRQEKGEIPDLKFFDTACKMVEHSGHYFDYQSACVFLSSSYALLGKQAEMTYYFKKALLLAQKYNCFFGILMQYFYIKKLFQPALADFPKDFCEKLENLSIDANRRYISFSDALSLHSVYKLLPQDDYAFLFYAVQGFTNKEVSLFLHVSESTVVKKYSAIYDTVGVKTKAELVSLYNGFDFQQTKYGV